MFRPLGFLATVSCHRADDLSTTPWTLSVHTHKGIAIATQCGPSHWKML